MTFSGGMRERRLFLRLKATECAQRAGMTKSVWSRWESGKTRRKDGLPAQPRMETVEAIARALDAPVAQALAAAGYKSDAAAPESFLAKEILAYLQRMDSRDQQRLREIARLMAA